MAGSIKLSLTAGRQHQPFTGFHLGGEVFYLKVAIFFLHYTVNVKLADRFYFPEQQPGCNLRMIGSPGKMQIHTLAAKDVINRTGECQIDLFTTAHMRIDINQPGHGIITLQSCTRL